MKITDLFKAFPFLTTLLLIIILNITNQKENTTLKILIWDTPSLSVGRYLALSTGAGFILSFIITTNLANTNQYKIKKSVRIKSEAKKELINNMSDTINNMSYENTLIERDIKDPSPTLDASFRIIGKSSRKKQSIDKYFYNDSDFSNQTNGYEDKSYSQNKNIKNDNQHNPILNDWNDQSYASW